MSTFMAHYLPVKTGVEYAWMNHPIWYMRPVHVVLARNGVTKLALGSSGHDGQAALARLVGWLADGCATALAVDGPGGPARVVKRGALELAVRTGLPIVAIRFEYSRALRLPGWDRKWMPVPGSHVAVVESAPLIVRRSNFESQRARLKALLG